MARTNRILCISIVLLSLVYKSSCIYCYHCNSANNSACIDVEKYDPEIRSRLIPIVDCNRDVPGPMHVDFFCRKIVQTIFKSRLESELRVTRSCGWIRHPKECYSANNQDHLETVCQCFENHCNSSDRVDSSTMSVLFLIFSFVLYFYR